MSIGDGYPLMKTAMTTILTLMQVLSRSATGFNNCDGMIDEGVTTTYYLDADGDGFGDDLNTLEACATPEGYVPFASDCDDEDATAVRSMRWH